MTIVKLIYKTAKTCHWPSNTTMKLPLLWLKLTSVVSCMGLQAVSSNVMNEHTTACWYKAPNSTAYSQVVHVTL